MTNLNIRERSGMPDVLKDGALTVAIVKVPGYSQLLCEAGRLQEALATAVLILDNLPGVSIDTNGFRQTLENSGWKNNVHTS